MRPLTGPKIFGNHMIEQHSYNVYQFMKLLIKTNDFKTATVINIDAVEAWFPIGLRKELTVENIYVKDPEFRDCPCINADPIFDDIAINSDIIITYNVERMYPPSRVYNGYHFMVSMKEIDLVEDTLDKETFGPFYVYHGEIKDVGPLHIPLYTSLQDRSAV